MNHLYVCKWLEYDARFDKIDFEIRIPVDFMALFEHRLRVRNFPWDLVESKIWADVTVSLFFPIVSEYDKTAKEKDISTRSGTIKKTI